MSPDCWFRGANQTEQGIAENHREEFWGVFPRPAPETAQPPPQAGSPKRGRNQVAMLFSEFAERIPISFEHHELALAGVAAMPPIAGQNTRRSRYHILH